MPDQHDEPNTEERRLAVQRREFDLLAQRVEWIERVVWGEEKTGLKGLLGRMTAIEQGISEIKDAIEKQAQDREKTAYGVQALLAGLGLNTLLGIGQVGRILGWW